MRDTLLHAAGLLGIMTAVIHGVLGETKVFARATIEPAWVKTLVRLVWQCSTVAWIGLGVLMLMAPHLGSDAARLWIIAVTSVVLGFGAGANAVATKGRHFGWVALLAVIGLAIAGI